MKTSLKLIAALLAVAASSVVHAQATVKLALVDISKAYDSHYSLPEQQEKIKSYTDKAQAEFERMMKEGQGLAEKYKELDEQSISPLLKEDAREKLTKEKEALAQEIQKKEEEVQGFRQSAGQQINNTVQQFRVGLVESITKVAVELGKKKGATVVIDKSAVSAAGFPIIMFADGSFDITDEVIAEINKGKPASVAKPAAAAPATTAPAATTPAANAPAVSFPGAKK